MSDKSDRGTGSSAAKNSDGLSRCEIVLAAYVERLTAGEPINVDAIRREHPDLAEELIEQLRLFEGVFEDSPVFNPLGTLGDYTLRRQIGRGGMGVVYEAWEGSMDRVVALKVLPAGVSADNKAFVRFMREAKTAGQLNHQNIVGVYSTGVKEGTPWYAMEYVEGETLAQALARIKDAETETPFGKKDGVVYFGKLAEAFAGVADGLQHAHSKNVLHRDIKPSNLILDSEGRLRILDFGLARLEGQESLTLSGDFVGTPLYMSPEQARRKKIAVDRRTDVYSLGATMYESICGRPPFRGKNHADTLSQIIEWDPVEPRKVNPRVPRNLETIVLKCLRKDPSDRYNSAEALAQDLQRFVRGDPVEARPEGRWEQVQRRLWRSRRLVAGAALVAVLLGGLFLAVLHARRAEREQSLADYRVTVGEAAGRLAAARLRIIGRYERWPVPGVLLAPWNLVRSPDRGVVAAQEIERITEDLEEALERVPDGRDGRYHLASAYHLAGNEARAREEVKRLLNIDEGFVPGLYLRARIRKEPFVVVPDTDVAGDSRAGWWDAWVTTRLPQIMGDQFQLKDWKRVSTAYDLLIGESLEPYLGFTAEAYLGRGIAHLALRNLERAQQDFSVARFLTGVLETDVLLAQAYAVGGNFEAAREILARAHTRFKDRGQLQEQEAVLDAIALYARLGNYDEALAWTDLIRDGLPVRLRARLLTLADRFDEAATEVEAFVRDAPHDPLAWETLASTLLERLDATREPTPEIVLRAVEACDQGLQLAAKRSRFLHTQRLRAIAWGQRGLSERAEHSGLAGDPWEAVELRGITGSEDLEIHEDFIADPDLFDGTPVLWEMIPCCEEHVTLAPGRGLVLDHRSPDPNTRLRLYSDRAWAGDLRLQARISYSGDQGGPWLFCHLNGRAHYVAGVNRYSADEIMAHLERWDPGGRAIHKTTPLRFDPATEEDFFLELLVTGDDVEFRAWPGAKERPEAPHLKVKDGTYRSGKFGIGYDGDGALVVSSLRITVAESPDPKDR